jgi:hypothetical protein
MARPPAPPTGADTDGDTFSALEEWMALTATRPTRYPASPADRHCLASGRDPAHPRPARPPARSRYYDVYWTTNLPQGTWNPSGFNQPGNANGEPIQLLLTNRFPSAAYRSGVRLNP